MLEAVLPDEVAFALTLFVAAAEGRVVIGNPPASAAQKRERQQAEQRFHALAATPQAVLSSTQPPTSPASPSTDTPLFRAFLALWLHYQGHPTRDSLTARVLGFYFLTERSRGTILTDWATPSASERSIDLHPAVVETIATVPLDSNDLMDAEAFVAQIALTAQRYPAHTSSPALPKEAPWASSWPIGTSQTAGLIRALDWSKTALGTIDLWPQSLRTAVDLTLGCQFAMIVLWGPNLIQIYNDPYAVIMGSKHPGGLGQATRLCWEEVWKINEPIYTQVLQGSSITFEDQLFSIRRYGYLENAWFTLCYSPLRNDSALIEGVLVTVFETTQRVKANATRTLSLTGEDEENPEAQPPLNAKPYMARYDSPHSTPWFRT